MSLWMKSILANSPSCCDLVTEKKFK